MSIYRYIIWILVCLFTTLKVSGQSTDVVERIYVSTDKGSYVAGEGIGCALYCFDVTGGKLRFSELSSVAYVELVSAEGVAQQEKVTLLEGRGSAVIKLSPDLPTGNYKLVAYTRQNRNEVGFVPYARDISIYNTLLASKIEGNVVLEAPSEETEGAVIRNTPFMEVVCDDTYGVTVKNLSSEKLFYNISVYRQDKLEQLQCETLENFGKYVSGSKGKSFVNGFVPDFEGEVFHFKSDAIGKNMLLSFPGENANVYISDVDENGDLYFYAGSIYGEKEGLLQVMPGYTDRSHKSELVSPFIGSFDFEYPPLYLNEEMEGDLVARGVGMQLGRRFGLDTLNVPMELRGDPFLEEPDKSYLLDDYTRFHTMHEVITEYVSNVRIRLMDKKRVFSVLFKDAVGNESYSRFTTLVLLDGMPVFDHEDILAYDPMLVKQIRVYAHSYRLSDITYEGVICFDTYKGDIPSFPIDSTSLMFTHKGSLYPEYISGERLSEGGEIPDYRHTLYWHPAAELDPREAEKFVLTPPKNRGTFNIVIEGVTASGVPFQYKTNFEIL